MNACLAPTSKPLPTESRPPSGHMGFSWSRVPHQNGVEYRLFRRDLHGRLYVEARRFYRDQDRSEIAERLNAARNVLRDHVDAIVLQQLGVTEQ